MLVCEEAMTLQNVFLQVMEAVPHCHRLGTCHRDLSRLEDHGLYLDPGC
jgi:hypothetical protein